MELSNGINGTWCCEIMGVNEGQVGTAKFIGLNKGYTVLTTTTTTIITTTTITTTVNLYLTPLKLVHSAEQSFKVCL